MKFLQWITLGRVERHPLEFTSINNKKSSLTCCRRALISAQTFRLSAQMAGQYLPINCHKHKLSIFLSPDVAGAEGILKFKYKIKCPIEIAYNEHPRQTVFHLWQWDAMNPRQLRTATEQDRETDNGRAQRRLLGPQQIILEKRRELCTHLVWPLLMKMNSIRWVYFPHTEMQIP